MAFLRSQEKIAEEIWCRWV